MERFRFGYLGSREKGMLLLLILNFYRTVTFVGARFPVINPFVGQRIPIRVGRTLRTQRDLLSTFYPQLIGVPKEDYRWVICFLVRLDRPVNPGGKIVLVRLSPSPDGCL